MTLLNRIFNLLSHCWEGYNFLLGFLGLFIDFNFIDLDLETVAILKFRNAAALLLMHMYMNLYMYTCIQVCIILITACIHVLIY